MLWPLALAVLAAAAWALAVEPRRLVVRYVRTGGPIGRALRIVLISDTHLVLGRETGRLERLERALVAVTRAAPPDLVVIAGDVLEDSREAPLLVPALVRTCAAAVPPERQIYVPGNHEERGHPRAGILDVVPAIARRHARHNDLRTVLGAFSAAGVHVLSDDAVTLCGVRIVGLRYRAAVGPSPAGAATLAATDDPTLVVAHSPDQLSGLPPSVVLGLAGHTHGGQVRLPLVPPLFTSTHRRPPQADGLMAIDGRPVVISRGVGQSIGIRFFAPPDITVVEVVPVDGPAADRQAR